MMKFKHTHLLSGLLIATALKLNAAQKPNIIYIKTDDQRYDALSMTGHPVTKTPNIDKLASQAVFFNKAFITSPICGPSRANTFSAQWERKNRVGFTMISKNVLEPEVFDNSWLVRLRENGYVTGYVGKTHVSVGANKDKYMQKNIDFCYMQMGHLGFNLKRHKVFNNLKHQTQIEGLSEASDVFMQPGKDKTYFYKNAHSSVKGFLHERPLDKPFALSINFNLPHASSIGGMGSGKNDPEMYRSLYQDQMMDFTIPAGFESGVEKLPKNVFQKEELMGYYKYKNADKLRLTMIRMARANAAIDNFVGHLRKQLDELGIADNTIIIYASDHGLLLGEHGLGGKTFLYEESIQIPMIIYSPLFTDKQKGQRLNDLVVGQDIPATILDLCGLPTPDTYQGRSVLPLIQGKPVEWRKEVFCENLFTMQGYPRMEAVRGERYKYIRYFSKENDRDRYLPDASINGEQPIYEELFDLETDPKEQQNLATNPEHAALLKTYRQRCQELVVELAK